MPKDLETPHPATPYAGSRMENGRFVNPSGRAARGLRDVLRWKMEGQKAEPWPRTVASVPARKPANQMREPGIRATVVGHSTVLLQVAGLNILTDPVWSNRVGPTSWLGPRRVLAPAIPFEDLPAIDVVLLSHNHYDHLDRPTLAALAKRDNPRIVTGLKVGKAVPSNEVTELDWWERSDLSPEVQATYVPAEHFSARGPFDRDKTLWGGFVVTTPSGTIYFAGDTGHGEHFAQIRRRFGPMTLSLLPIGAYEPRWFMAPVHIGPDEAVAAASTLESRVSVAIHFGAFPLADDGMETPLRELTQALAERPGPPIDFRVPRFGFPIDVPSAGRAPAEAANGGETAPTQE
ncbi:MBL fold metallo-hydrolase [Azospirillum doebereinerae]|uniref:Metallo-beta-lactamase domain-containing protein n=1 Tax=Azospirillum doebereinerae TaxID=92933 RepID=A0A433J8M1_9PROT|nr:MBL fold metallo-hydrolase [Azospirillum doebereinerae]RUQ70693.1 hypothetical protein EJ913_13020 [Azospirillum doebereinerae]